MAKKKSATKQPTTKIPTGKSAIRQAILKVLQSGSKSLAVDTSNVTKAHIEDYLGNFPEQFTPASLKSGAKFIRAIRDKSKVDGKLLFGDGQKKDALTGFASALDEGGVAYKKAKEIRSPSYRYTAKATKALGTATKDVDGKVMYQLPDLYVVTIQKGDEKKKKVLGGYADASSAKASAKAYLTGLKKAYDPLIPSFTSGKTKTGRTSNIRDKLKIEVSYKTKKKKIKGVDKDVRTGEATYKFENNKALDYVKKHLDQKGLTVRVIKVTDKKEHRDLWKLFNSPAVGKMRWNPKKR